MNATYLRLFEESFKCDCCGGEYLGARFLTADQSEILCPVCHKKPASLDPEFDLDELADALATQISDALEDVDIGALAQVQPPSSIMYEAVRAAVAVLMAFERGYRMGPEEDDEIEEESQENG